MTWALVVIPWTTCGSAAPSLSGSRPRNSANALPASDTSTLLACGLSIVPSRLAFNFPSSENRVRNHRFQTRRWRAAAYPAFRPFCDAWRSENLGGWCFGGPPYGSGAHLRCDMEITVWTVVQTVLTATFNSYGNRQISTPTKSIPLNWSTRKSAQLIISTRGSPIPNLVQIHPLMASDQMDEI